MKIRQYLYKLRRKKTMAPFLCGHSVCSE